MRYYVQYSVVNSTCFRPAYRSSHFLVPLPVARLRSDERQYLKATRYDVDILQSWERRKRDGQIVLFFCVNGEESRHFHAEFSWPLSTSINTGQDLRTGIDSYQVIFLPLLMLHTISQDLNSK
jgi:hypothetical protein